MEYFRLMQSGLSVYQAEIPQLRRDTGILRPGAYAKLLHKGTGSAAYQIKNTVLTDFIEEPVFLVSDELFLVLEMYEPALENCTVLFFGGEEGKAQRYRQIVPDVLPCLSDRSEFFKDYSLKRLVFSESGIGRAKVFCAKGILSRQIFISLDVAESILRRNFSGIAMNKIETE